MTSITSEQSSSAEAKGLPSDMPIPAALIGYLGVDQRDQGQGVGEFLLMDALRRIVQSEVACVCIVVDAIDDRAARWYQRYGFQTASLTPRRLVIGTDTVKALFSKM